MLLKCQFKFYFHFIFIIYLMFFYISDFIILTKKSHFHVMQSLFWLSTIAQKKQQSASKVACPCLYRIALCLNEVVHCTCTYCVDA